METRARETFLTAFDRLFDCAAAKLNVACTAEEKLEARRTFAERFSNALDVVDNLGFEIPESALSRMEAAIAELSPAQVVGYLAAIPLARHAQEMMQAIVVRAAEQRLLEHYIAQADDRYGGN